MSQGLVLTAAGVAAAGSVLADLPVIQDALIGAGAGVTATRLAFAYLERSGVAMSEVHRRRIEAAAVVGGATVGSIAYVLLG